MNPLFKQIQSSKIEPCGRELMSGAVVYASCATTATTSQRDIWRGCLGALSAILLVAALLLTVSVTEAGSSTPLCKDVTKFGAVLNDPHNLGRAGFVELIHYSQKISHEAPRSAQPAWSAVTSDLTKVLEQGGGTKKTERDLSTALRTAHREVLKVCG